MYQCTVKLYSGSPTVRRGQDWRRAHLNSPKLMTITTRLIPHQTLITLTLWLSTTLTTQDMGVFSAVTTRTAPKEGSFSSDGSSLLYPRSHSTTIIPRHAFLTQTSPSSLQPMALYVLQKYHTFGSTSSSMGYFVALAHSNRSLLTLKNYTGGWYRSAGWRTSQYASCPDFAIANRNGSSQSHSTHVRILSLWFPFLWVTQQPSLLATKRIFF